MKCEHIKQLLPVYLNDELDHQQSVKVKNHLDTCSGCQSELAEMQEMEILLETHLKPEPAPDLQVKSNKSKSRTYYFRYVAAAVLVCVIILLVVQSDQANYNWENNRLSELTEMNENLDILEATGSADHYASSEKDDLFYTISEDADYLETSE
jgi:predicted anti-sigma-YlaC factor YlaD